MLGEISSRALAEWMAFFSLEPFGYEANLAGHAITSSVLANTNRKKGAKPFKPADFLPQEEKAHEPGDFVKELKDFLQAGAKKNEGKRKKTSK